MYDGEWKNGKYDGKGKLYKDGKLLYDGEWKNGKYDGKGKEYEYRHGTLLLLYEGNWKDGTMHGKGTLYWRSGNVWYDGEWENGTRHGRGKMYDPEGILEYDGELKDSVPNGRGAKIYPDGRKYVGEFKNWAYVKGKLYRSDGSLKYEGEWKYEEMVKGKEYYKNGTLLYEGEFKTTELEDEEYYWNGKGKLYRSDGKLLYDGEFENGKGQGSGITYRKDRVVETREIDLNIYKSSCRKIIKKQLENLFVWTTPEVLCQDVVGVISQFIPYHCEFAKPPTRESLIDAIESLQKKMNILESENKNMKRTFESKF